MIFIEASEEPFWNFFGEIKWLQKKLNKQPCGRPLNQSKNPTGTLELAIGPCTSSCKPFFFSLTPPPPALFCHLIHFQPMCQQLCPVRFCFSTTESSTSRAATFSLHSAVGVILQGGKENVLARCIGLIESVNQKTLQSH